MRHVPIHLQHLPDFLATVTKEGLPTCLFWMGPANIPL